MDLDSLVGLLLGMGVGKFRILEDREGVNHTFEDTSKSTPRRAEF